jgi:hypothetical protein
MATSRDVLASMAIRIGIDSANMSKSLNKISTDMNVFKNGLKTLGKAIAGIFAVDQILKFGKESFAAYQEQYKAEQLLLTALKGRKEIQEKLIRQAEYLQKTTLFSDDEIINQQKLLAATGISEKKIREVIKAATQLATAFDTDLGSAVKMLTGSYSGNLRELGKMIPELKHLTKGQLAAGEAVNWVNENMKNLAETAGNTDPITQMSKAWDELKESFGKAIAPMVTRFAETGTKEFTIWNSKELSFWQKASQLFNKKRTNELYDYVLGLEAVKQEQDDLSASTTETVIPDLEAEAKARAEIVKQLEAQRKSLRDMAKDMQGSMSVPSDRATALFQPESKVGRVASGYKENGQLTNGSVDSFAAFRAKRDAMVMETQEAYLKIQDMTKAFTDAINDMITNMAVGFAEGIGTMIGSGQRANWNMVLNPIADAMSSLGKLAIAAGITTLGIKKALQSMNGYVAIAAGMALVTLAAAVKSGMNNIASGSGYTTSMSTGSSGQSASYLDRKMNEGYTKIDVNLVLRNDHLAVASARGQSQNNRW